MGFIDKQGNIVIKPTFFNVGEFKEGMTMLFFGGERGFGFADRTGKIIIDKKFRAAANFVNGIAWVYPSDHGEKYILYGGTYIDKTGKYIWNPKEKNEAFGAKCNN